MNQKKIGSIDKKKTAHNMGFAKVKVCSTEEKFIADQS
jgi:hypothetical protein